MIVCVYTDHSHSLTINSSFAYSILILIILSPLLQMAVFCLAYGREAEDIKFYVANFDSKTGYNIISNCAYTYTYVHAVKRFYIKYNIGREFEIYKFPRAIVNK